MMMIGFTDYNPDFHSDNQKKAAWVRNRKFGTVPQCEFLFSFPNFDGLLKSSIERPNKNLTYSLFKSKHNIWIHKNKEQAMAKPIPLSESLEDYLETILKLQTEKTVARSKDIANELDIKRGSVTGMLKKLAANEMINYEPYGYVTLTAKGKKIAKEIQTRHTVIKDFLFRILGVEEEQAEQTACRMEHAMDPDTFKRFTEFIKRIDACPHSEVDAPPAE